MAYKWVVVKIEVPFRVLDIIRRLILGHPKRAQKFDNYPSILTLLSLLITTLNPITLEIPSKEPYLKEGSFVQADLLLATVMFSF